MNPSRFYELLDEVDACVFSGDDFCDPGAREHFLQMLARWQRGVQDFVT